MIDRDTPQPPRPALSRAAAVLIASLSLPSAASAGPWTRGPGQFYVKVAEGLFWAEQFVDAAGRTVDAEYLGATTSLYAEVGLIENLQVVLFLPHLAGRNTRPNGDRYLSVGGGDASLGLQASTPWLSFPHAVRAEVKVPLYDVTEPGGPEGEFFPNRGDGQVDATAWLCLGESFQSPRVYGFVDLGYRHRSEAFVGPGTGLSYGDGLVWMAQIGWTPFADVVIAFNSFGVVPFVDDEVTKGYVTVGPALFAPFWGGLAFEAGYDHTVWAHNSAVGQAFTAGLSYNRF